MPPPSFAAVSYSEGVRSSVLKLLLLKSFFGVLYTLLKKEEIFSNLNRARIYQVVSDFPGINYLEIANKTKFSTGVLLYHLSVLERERIIITYPDGRFKRYRLHPEQEKKSALEVTIDLNKMDKSMQERIVKIIKENDGISQKEICRKVGGSKQLVSYHIKKLENDDVIKTRKYGRITKCYSK